jgi:hypothetical protein
MINLDCMTADALTSFWQQYRKPSRKMAADLFGGTPEGYIRAAKDVANYASNKATAMQCRMRGDMQAAGIYERICERIYEDLPEFARW